MTIQIFSRSMNPDLHQLAAEFWPDGIERIRCDNFQKWYEAGTFLHHVIGTAASWAVICDDDCFITDWPAVEAMVADMQKQGYHYAGVPDGGVIPHRCYSWATMNPFFLVLDCDTIRKHLDPQWVIDSCGFFPRLEEKKPCWITGAYHHLNNEPFHPLFYWLAAKLNPLYLDAQQHSDGISTLPLWNGRPFALHSWYSREFNHDIVQRNRILSLHNEAKQCLISAS